MNNTDIIGLKRKARALGLCGEYSERWARCGSTLDMLCLATDANGIAFTADFAAFGWGLSQEYIKENFADHINGASLIDHDGYTSELYCGAENIDCEVRATQMLFIGCTGRVHVPKHHICRLYVSAECDLVIENEGVCELCVYGTDNMISVKGDSNRVSRKAVTRSEWA